MKRCFSRRQFCRGLAAGAAALALAGCTGPDTSGSVSASAAGPSASPAGSTGPDQAFLRADLEDGRFRLFCGSTDAAFVGGRCICTASAHGQVLLLEDKADPGLAYFAAAEPQGSDAYAYRILDGDGALVYDCGTSHPLALAAGWLLLSDSSDTVIGGSRMVRPDTGETVSLPDGTRELLAVDGQYLCTVTWAGEGTFSALYDREMQPVRQLPGYAAARADDLSGWLILYGDNGGTTLYQPATARTIAHFSHQCGPRCVALDAAGDYAVVDLDSGETLARPEGFCYWYTDACILWQDEAGRDYLRQADGADLPVWSYSRPAAFSEEDTVFLVLAQEMRCYDMAGQLLYALPTEALDLPERPYAIYATAMPGQRALLEIHPDDSFQNARYAVCSAEGVTELTSDRYRTIYPQWESSFLVAYRADVPDDGQQTLCDLLGPDGALLVAGVRLLGGTILGNILPVRRGFAEGWMNGAGQWLWSRSIWQTPEDNDNLMY